MPFTRFLITALCGLFLIGVLVIGYVYSWGNSLNNTETIEQLRYEHVEKIDLNQDYNPPEER